MKVSHPCLIHERTDLKHFSKPLTLATSFIDMAMFVSEYLKSYRKTVEGAVFSGVANAKAYVEGWTSQVASDIPVVVEQDPEILDPILSPYAATFATFKARVFEAAQSQEKRAMALRIIVIAMMVFTSWRTFKNLQTQKALYVSL